MSFEILNVRFWARRHGLSTDDVAERWTERAAIREYEGGAVRELAEEGAWADLRARYAPEELPPW